MIGPIIGVFISVSRPEIGWLIRPGLNILVEAVSFGIGSNKMLAKIATNLAKPNGFLQIPFGKEKEFLGPLPVEAIPGVGDHTKEVLHAMGIFRIHHLADAGTDVLEKKFGKWGIDLWQKSQGLHEGKVASYHEAKSVSTEHTFDENVSDTKFLLQTLVSQTEKVCYELRKDGKVAGCVAVKIRYPDFETTSRQQSIDWRVKNSSQCYLLLV